MEEKTSEFEDRAIETIQNETQSVAILQTKQWWTMDNFQHPNIHVNGVLGGEERRGEEGRGGAGREVVEHVPCFTETQLACNLVEVEGAQCVELTGLCVAA